MLVSPTSRPTTGISRRTLIGRAASSVVSVVVSQSLLGCAASDPTAATTDTSSSDSTSPSCVLTAALTEGPYFVDEKLNRADIRTDPVTGAVSPGVLLQLTFNVSRFQNNACTPLTGAYIDVWHCDAGGVYSDVSGTGSGHKFLRGYQITDANGQVTFETIYPGWYQGRAVHIHFKLRLFAGSTKTYEFTSQFFFAESLTDAVHAQSPYSAKG
ncbi:MAG TPA: hypothetical protein VJO33_13470, partial [Gemmatimonadaceae bacterium]|nr:hypothetical protein [Gemmatimonadaceae bacterium]